MPTPFTPDGDIDGGRVRQLVEFLLEGGVDGLFPLGTTGEFALLSRSERKKVVSLTVDAANGRVPVLCGVSDPATENVRCFIRDAEDAGSDGVVVTPPYYFRLKGEQECYSYFSGISRMTDLPLFVYNIPEWTGTLIPAEALSRLAEEGLIAGMKYTEYNLLALLKYIDSLKGRIALFTGSDAMAYTNMEFGGDGAIIAVSNVAPRRAASIYDLLESGDAEGARRAQQGLLPAIEAIGIGDFPAGLKEAMRLVGMPVGNPRWPISPLNPESRREVRKLLSRAGLTGAGGAVSRR